jgi:predicted site-specific integrase-resolvase
MVNQQLPLLSMSQSVREATGRDFHIVTIRKWRREGRLRGCVKIGREWFCTVEDVRQMIMRDTERAQSATKPD